ncbi:MAG TPA: hypothetical protein VK983_00655, partial [Candidatus Limnocylindrales bacterium]|nr:hypothetical protein [Candidatus Limnocylindrales bacterium]
YGGEKMSKSLGNLVFAKDLLKSYDASTIRLALMHYHYREGGEWIPELLVESRELLDRCTAAAARASTAATTKLYMSVIHALEDDLDTHAVVHHLDDFATSPDDYASVGTFQDKVLDGREYAFDATLALLGLTPSGSSSV